MGKIILGSSSPRRADILKKMHLDFEIIPSGYEEVHDRTDFSYEFVENLAYNKAIDVAKKIKENAIVIGADTIVVSDNKILGKPENKQQAYDMLNQLSGHTHSVVTAIAVIKTPSLEYKIKSTTTDVTFEKLSEKQITDYIENYQPYDKAGAYGIQELPEGYVKNVKGSVDNVIGLPVETLRELLKEFS